RLGVGPGCQAPRCACRYSAVSSADRPWLRGKLSRIGTTVGTLLSTAACLAVMGIWWWPVTVLTAPLLFVVCREALSDGGLLDPAPFRKGLAGEVSVASQLDELGPDYRSFLTLILGAATSITSSLARRGYSP